MSYLLNFNTEIIEKTQDSIIATLGFDEDHPFVDGHFDGFKILPGAAQIGVAKSFVEKILGRDIALKKVVKSKFLDVTIPDKTIKAEVHIERAGHAVWNLKQRDHIMAKGNLFYE